MTTLQAGGWLARIPGAMLLAVVLLAVVLLPPSAPPVRADDCGGQCDAGRDKQNCLTAWMTCKGMDSNELLFAMAEKFTDTPLVTGVLRAGAQCIVAVRSCNGLCDKLSLSTPDDIREACIERCTILRNSYCPK